MKPDFNNCILNVTSSIMKKYNLKSNFLSNKIVDERIKKAKHVFFIVLDGLGKNIIENNLDKDSFIRSHITDWITSVYPPTTVAATTACLSGINPGESGWIGWHQYFEEINQEVVLFKNTNAYTNQKISFDVADKYIPYTPFYHQFTDTLCYSLYPSFKQEGFSTFKDMCDEIIRISKLNNATYTYCYWDNPDYTIHEFGVRNNKIKEIIYELNNNIEKIYQNCDKNTTIILIADHGLVDVEHFYLEDYPDFLATLELYPSLEARTVAFKVKNKEEFEKLFSLYFGKYFKLYSSDEFIKEGYLGTCTTKTQKFLHDYVAIATDKYCLNLTKGDFIMKATHAGATEDEMIIPLIILNK